MGLPAFDTLQIFEDLEKAGFDEPKAKAISAVVRKVHDSSDVATKADLQHLEERVDTKLDKLGAQLRHEIGALRTVYELLRKDMDAKHESLRKDMDAKFAGVDATFADERSEIALCCGKAHPIIRISSELCGRFGGVEPSIVGEMERMALVLHRNDLAHDALPMQLRRRNATGYMPTWNCALGLSTVISCF